MSAALTGARDPYAPSVALDGSGLLGDFNRAGVLGPADVHVAIRLSRLAGETDDRVALAVALSVRGPRFGHVRTNLRDVRSIVATDVDDRSNVEALVWPEEEPWLAAVAQSRLVTVGPNGGNDRPLRLVNDCLYLDRYWCDECFVADDLLRRCSDPGPNVDETVLKEGLLRLFGPESAKEQRWAAALAVLQPLTVIAGGPGTGKTTTIARIIALLHEQADAAGVGPPLIALVAPTGKAAARMEEAVRLSATVPDLSEGVRGRLQLSDGLTIHRLLRRRPDSSSRFRHDRNNRLPHDVVIIDETSMVSLSLMARLLEAVRADAKIILVGDPEQLASVEAGAVLGDIVGPAADRMIVSTSTSNLLGEVTGVPPEAPVDDRYPSVVGDRTVLLRSNFRFSGALADLATAVRLGEPDPVLEVLNGDRPEVEWVNQDTSAANNPGTSRGPLALVRRLAVSAGAAMYEASVAGDGNAALEALADFRLLCAHRSGPAGVDVWAGLVEEWLTEDVEGFNAESAWYAGRPVMITANDYTLRLFNGDTGVTVARRDGGLEVVFPRGRSLLTVGPGRLSATETVFATTVHKSQGSEFEKAALVLPPPDSPLLTRELLYTAVTRAKRSLVVVGTEAAVRTAVSRPIARASGLTDRLWPTPARGPRPEDY